MPNDSRCAARARNEAATDGVAAVALTPSTRPRSAPPPGPGGRCRSGPSWPCRNPAASAAASTEPTSAASVVIAEPASSGPMTSRNPIAVAPPIAAMPAPMVTASVLASTRWRRDTTCGSAADSPASMNRLTPATLSAAM